MRGLSWGICHERSVVGICHERFVLGGGSVVRDLSWRCLS
jgi:hypothetical protein